MLEKNRPLNSTMKSEEATQSIEYSRTIVPSSMRSPYWKYFGFPSDNANNVLTKQKIICTLCNTAIAYNKNTSNLRTHLIAKHCQLFHEMHQQTMHKRTNSEMMAQTTVELASDYMVKKAKEDFSFTNVRAHESIEDDYKIVEDDDDVEEMIDQSQPTGEISVTDAVDFADYATVLQTDEPQTEQEHKQENGDEVHQDVDDTYGFIKVGNACPTGNASAKTTEEFDLDDFVIDMLVTDLLPTYTIGGHGFTQLINQFGALSKSSVEFKLAALYEKMYEEISLHLKKICESQPYSLCVELSKNVDNVMVVCVYVNYYSADENEILSVLYQNHVLTDDLKDASNCSDFESIFKDFDFTKCAAVVLNEPNAVVELFFRSHDIPIVPCLDSVLSRCMSYIFELPRVKSEFNAVLKSAEKISKATNNLLTELPEVYPQCAWSKLNLLLFCNENLSFNDFDSPHSFSKIIELVDYVYPLKITLETIADEPLSLCSLMRPFTLKLLEEHFSAHFADEHYLSEVKQIMSGELTNSILKNPFLNEATFFDARFRNDFLDAHDMEAIKAGVCERFKSLIEHVAESVGAHVKEESNVNYTSGSNRKSSLKSFFQRKSEGNLEPAAKRKLHIEHEFHKYNCEPALDLDHCPISWWHDNAFTFKQLKQIADYYLSVPCCVNRLFKSSISERNELQNKRFMLRNDKAQQIWYLHYNKSYYEVMSRHKQPCVYLKNK